MMYYTHNLHFIAVENAFMEGMRARWTAQSVCRQMSRRM